MTSFFQVLKSMADGAVIDDELGACIAERLSWRSAAPPPPLPDRWTAHPCLQPGAVNRSVARANEHAGALGLVVSWEQPFAVRSAANVRDEEGGRRGRRQEGGRKGKEAGRSEEGEAGGWSLKMMYIRPQTR